MAEPIQYLAPSVAIVAAGISVWAAVNSKRRDQRAENLAERRRQDDIDVRQASLRRKLEAALIQLHMEQSTTFHKIRNAANQNPRQPITGTQLRLDHYYAKRLFDLQPELSVLPDAEAAIMDLAIERTREFDSYVATAVPDLGQDPFVSVPGFGMAVGPLVSRAYYAVRPAINHYRPELAIADL